VWLSVAGLLVTLHSRLPSVIVGLCSTGVFVCQIVTNRSIGVVAGHARASAVGLYVTIYYLGSFAGSIVPGLMWPLGGWPVCVALIGTVLAVAQLVVLTV
jgi:predicted MFS family arabinose efflux permease